jgi:glyoxylase-like metal-dependent hydrolase (beta-lactamase superfamily II)
MILKRFEVAPFYTNLYIVGSEVSGEGMIIDPAGGAEAALEGVQELGLTIKLLVATHAHLDHFLAARQLKEATGAEFAMHPSEAGTLGAQSRFAGSLFGTSGEPPPEPDRLLGGGDSIEIGELRFLVLDTPGHSPGGISLYGHGVVFSGDSLFNFGIGRTDFPGCSFDQLMESIKTKLMTLPDETIVLPGHGPQSTIGVERDWNPFLKE